MAINPATVGRSMAEVGPGADSEIRVVLADDHELIRSSMRSVLDGEDGIAVVAEAAEVESAVRSVRLHRAHVLVCDLRLPALSNVATIQLIRDRIARTR